MPNRWFEVFELHLVLFLKKNPILNGFYVILELVQANI